MDFGNLLKLAQKNQLNNDKKAQKIDSAEKAAKERIKKENAHKLQLHEAIKPRTLDSKEKQSISNGPLEKGKSSQPIRKTNVSKTPINITNSLKSSVSSTSTSKNPPKPKRFLTNFNDLLALSKNNSGMDSSVVPKTLENRTEQLPTQKSFKSGKPTAVVSLKPSKLSPAVRNYDKKNQETVYHKKDSKLTSKSDKKVTTENKLSLLDAYSNKPNKPLNKPIGIAAQFAPRYPAPITKSDSKKCPQKNNLPPMDVDVRLNSKTSSNRPPSSQHVKRPSTNPPLQPPPTKKSGITTQLSNVPKKTGSGIAAQFGTASSAPKKSGISAQFGSNSAAPKRSGIAAQFGCKSSENKMGYSSEEEEYDSDLDDFIDDSEQVSQREYSNAIQEIQKSLRFDPTKYQKVSKYDDCSTMEASYRDISREEARSLRIAAKEDAELLAQEIERKKRKMQRV